MYRLTIIVCTVVLIGVAAAVAQPSFTILSEHPDGKGHYSAAAVSANGRIAAGYYRKDPAPSIAVAWVLPDNRLFEIGDLPGEAIDSRPTALSADGSTIVGQSESHFGREAFRWTPEGGMRGLGDIKGGRFWSFANDVSADGTVIVGYGTSNKGREPFRWTESGGMESLGFLGEAIAVSDDGRTIVGYLGDPFTNQPGNLFIWTRERGMVSDDSASELRPTAASKDGAVVVGRVMLDPAIWRSGTGIQKLPLPPHARFGWEPTAISGAAEIVVGFGAGEGFSKNVHIWSENKGVRLLSDVLKGECGLDLGGWTPLEAEGITDDGRTIVGRATKNSEYRGYVAILGDPGATAGRLATTQPAVKDWASTYVASSATGAAAKSPAAVVQDSSTPQPKGKPPANAETKPLLDARGRFAAKIKMIERGTLKEKVRELLGEPDDIRTSFDREFSSSSDDEVWCYGTHGHMTTPTLGSVAFDEWDVVTSAEGKGDYSPAAELFTEDELQSWLRVIDRVTTDPSPLTIVQVTNALQPLGRERVVHILREHARVRSQSWGGPGTGGTEFLARVLFDPPEDPGYMMKVFSSVPPPEDPWMAPRWPVVIIDDVPLLVAGGGSVISGSFSYGLDDPHTKWVLEKCPLRSEPLRPSAKPADVFNKIVNSKCWTFTNEETTNLFQPKDEDGRRIVVGQLLRLVSSVYSGELQPNYTCPGSTPTGKPMDQILADLAGLNIRWDDQLNDFTLPDGHRIGKTATSQPVRIRHVWKPDLTTLDIKLSMMRKDDQHVAVHLNWRRSGDQPAQVMQLVIVNADDETKELESFEVGSLGSFPQHAFPESMPPEARKKMEELRKSIPPNTRMTSSGRGGKLDIPTGTKVKAILTGDDGKKLESPAYQP